jgi:hypothetical protein
MLVRMVVFYFAMTSMMHRSAQYVVNQGMWLGVARCQKVFEALPLDPSVKKNVLGAKSFRIDEVASCLHKS